MEVDKETKESTVIRCYGLDPNGDVVCVKVEDFTPYIYVELPRETINKQPIVWNQDLALSVGRKIVESMDSSVGGFYRRQHSKPAYFVRKKKLYSAQLSDGRPNAFPFIFMKFHSKMAIWKLKHLLQKPLWSAVGKIRLKIHEESATEPLQLVGIRDIPSVGWVDFEHGTGGGRLVPPHEKETRARREYRVGYKRLSRHTGPSARVQGTPYCLSFDIEVNSSVPSRMPDCREPGDVIFQISCVFFTAGPVARREKEILLTLGDPYPEVVGAGVEIRRFRSECLLLEGWSAMVKEENPSVLMGYNILGFDLPYMIGRAELWMVDSFFYTGMHQHNRCEKREISWNSSAYKNQKFEFIEMEGRVIIDLLVLVKKDFNFFNNFKLATVASHFLGATKDPLDHKGIFKCYREGIETQDDGSYSHGARQAMSIVGKYCMVDSRLVRDLSRKIQTWIGMCEMARVCNVPLFHLVVKGQQVKVFSQIYRFCTKNNIVVESDGYKAAADERYVGAYVFQPQAGVYDNVVPFDFKSLYPTTIIAYNICPSTLVRDPRVPDHMCHVIEWEDHVGCQHDPKVIEVQQMNLRIDLEEKEIKKLRTAARRCLVRDFYPTGRGIKMTKQIRLGARQARDRKVRAIKLQIARRVAALKPYRERRAFARKGIKNHVMCKKRRYRFLKEPKGVMPTVLQNTLDARANTRLEIKDISKKIDAEGDPRGELKMLKSILNQRQLAFKICANSLYGALGVREGYLPFMPGAMCTTAMGRKNNILAANTIVENWKGKLIYGDSVTGDTPIMIKHANGMVDVVTIETLAHGDYEPYDQFKAGQSNRREKQQATVDVQVWADGAWANVNRVIRHKTKKRIFRVLTHTGCVDVTEDHSLLDARGQKLKPVDAKIGQELLHAFPTEFCSDCKEISREEAFVMGFFFGDGSCGDYACPSGRKCSWALNNSNLEYLREAQQCLEKCEPSLGWKVLDTIKSSGVYKLVPQGNVKYIVEKYRPLFYDKDKFKKVPMCILNAPVEVRAEFVRGYRVADGTKMGPQRADCKGKIGCQGLYYLFCSLGENVSINTRESKPDVFRLNSTRGKFRKSPSAIKKIMDLGYNNEDEFVYDIETTEGRFGGGVGSMILKNTDSQYCTFPHLHDDGKSKEENATVLWKYCNDVGREVTKLYPSPMELEFEETIYSRFLILSKKRYMYNEMDEHGVVKDKVGNKGVLLSRRDNCDAVREIYSALVQKIFNKEPQPNVLVWLSDQILDMMRGRVPARKFVVTKSVGSTGNLPLSIHYSVTGTASWQPKVENGKALIGDYKIPPLSKEPVERARQLNMKNAKDELSYYTNALPAHVCLAMKIRSRGIRVEPGSRLEYVITRGSGHKTKLCLKVEEIGYFEKHSRVLKMDYLYYLKSLSRSVDEVLLASYGPACKDFTKKMYDLHLDRTKLMREIRPPVAFSFL
jgi:DNA polymerase elongation subunit (family B)